MASEQVWGHLGWGASLLSHPEVKGTQGRGWRGPWGSPRWGRVGEPTAGPCLCESCCLGLVYGFPASQSREGGPPTTSTPIPLCPSRGCCVSPPLPHVPPSLVCAKRGPKPSRSGCGRHGGSRTGEQGLDSHGLKPVSTTGLGGLTQVMGALRTSGSSSGNRRPEPSCLPSALSQDTLWRQDSAGRLPPGSSSGRAPHSPAARWSDVFYSIALVYKMPICTQENPGSEDAGSCLTF